MTKNFLISPALLVSCLSVSASSKTIFQENFKAKTSKKKAKKKGDKYSIRD